MSAPARYATAPSGLPTDGLAVAVIARLLGTPLMPWQRQVANVACERRPDGSWRYPVVVVTVPRQSGKTVLMGAVMVHRAVTRPDAQVFYTAQTGKDAAERWRDVLKKCQNSEVFQQFIQTRLSAGGQAIEFPNSSAVRPFAPTANSLHGYTPPLVMIDEAMAHDAVDGTNLMGAIAPAQITIPDRQLWIVSTAGSANSTWLREWVDRGRAQVADPAATMAYFEWSMADDADPYHPDTWAGFHPALGHTITADALRDQIGVPHSEWLRAYCNVWTRTQTTVIPLSTWDALSSPLTKPAASARVAFGIDVTPALDGAAIVAAWQLPDGRTAVKPVLVAPGVRWLAAVVNAIRDAYPYSTMTADLRGPAHDVADDLGTLDPVTTEDATAGFAQWMRAVATRRIIHDGAAALRDAIANAATRELGDGHIWSAKASAGPIHVLRAATAAHRAANKPVHLQVF